MRPELRSWPTPLTQLFEHDVQPTPIHFIPQPIPLSQPCSCDVEVDPQPQQSWASSWFKSKKACGYKPDLVRRIRYLAGCCAPCMCALGVCLMKGEQWTRRVRLPPKLQQVGAGA